MPQFSPSLEDLRVEVEDSLRDFVTERRGALPDAAPLFDEIERMLDAGGKRLRPSFCYWGFRAAGGVGGDAVVRAVASLELLHTFALVHDDIMDRSENRRGVPTTFAQRGVDVALLVGDLALVLADECLFRSGHPAELLGAAFAPYSRMRQEVIAGQFLDIEAERKRSITVAEARRIAVLKSGRYSIQEPLAIGAALAGADEPFCRALMDFAEPLGEAFQLRDDLLGSLGDERATGKPVDSDIRAGKRHVLFAETLAALAGDDKDFFLEAWGGGVSLSEADVERLRGLLRSSGAAERTEALLSDLVAESARRLATLGLAEEPHAALAELARRSTDRHL